MNLQDYIGIAPIGISNRAGAPLASAHRYWRWVKTLNSGNPVSLGELELFDSNDFVTKIDTSGATITQQALIGNEGTTAANLFDGNTSNYYRAAVDAATSHWVQIDFGEGNAFNIQKVIVWPRASTKTEAPYAWEMHYSDDGVDWSVGWAHPSGGAWNGHETRRLSVNSGFAPPTALPSGGVAFWRFVRETGSNTTFAMAEFDFYDETDTIIDTSALDFFWPYATGMEGSPGSLFDSNTGTHFRVTTAGASADYAIIMEFPAAVLIDKIVAWSRSGLPDEASRDFRIEWSIDEEHWTEYWGVRGVSAWVDQGPRTFTALGEV